MSANDVTPAQLFSMLYRHMESPKTFGESFARDADNTIVASRLHASFAQEIIRLLMASVREDALNRGEDPAIAIEQAARTVQEALLEAKSCAGSYW